MPRAAVMRTCIDRFWTERMSHSASVSGFGRNACSNARPSTRLPKKKGDHCLGTSVEYLFVAGNRHKSNYPIRSAQ